MASFFAFYPPGSGGGSNASVGPTGQTAPTSATEVAGIDPSGNLHALQTDSSGNLFVNINSETGAPFHVIVDSSALPTGASTSALQTTGNTSLASILANQTNGTQETQVVGTVPLPTGAATSANQTNANQKTQIVDGSGNVIAATSNALNVAIQGTSPISGTVTANQGTSPWVENVSQWGGSATSLGQKTMAASVPVAIASDQSAITVAQATAASLNATVVQGTASNLKASVNLNDGSGSAVNKGQTTSAGSLPVVIASDQSALPTAQKGLAVANAPIQNVYSSTNITTAAYTQLIASTTSATTFVDIFDSSGQAMILAVGGSGSEVIQAYIAPGGDSFFLAIPAGSRVAYKALSANATSGYLLLNLRG